MNKDRVGVALIGCGRAGLIHGQNFAFNVPGAYLACVVDPVEENAKKASILLSARYYTDIHKALEQNDVHAVVVANPTIYHKETVIAAALAGKHVLCEKPMAMTCEECEEMEKAAKDHKVKLQIGFMRRFDENHIKAKRIVENGEIGEVVMVRSNTRGPSKPRDWMYDLSKSNGPLAEVNSHDIDTLRYFTNSEFKTVYASGGNFRSPDALNDYPDFYDNVILCANFVNGMQGMIDGAQGVCYGYDARVEILGTHGCIFIGNVKNNGRLVVGPDKVARHEFASSWTNMFSDAYLNEDIAFIQCILDDTEPLVTAYDGKMAVKVVNAGNISIRENRMITL